MQGINHINWLTGDVSKKFILADVQRVRAYFKSHNSEYVIEIWLAIERALREWEIENRAYCIKSLGLEDAGEYPVFKVAKMQSEEHLLCSDFVFVLATEGKYQPVIDVIRKHGLEHVMAAVYLYYLIYQKEREASRALYWLDRILTSKYREEKTAANKKSHAVDEEAKAFAQKIAHDTWREEREDSDSYTDKKGMLEYVLEKLLLAGFYGRSVNKLGYSDVVVWKWVKDLAPNEVRKPGARSKRK